MILCRGSKRELTRGTDDDHEESSYGYANDIHLGLLGSINRRLLDIYEHLVAKPELIARCKG